MIAANQVPFSLKSSDRSTFVNVLVPFERVFPASIALLLDVVPLVSHDYLVLENP